MNIYVSDKDEIEMIKKWFRENGKFTLICISLALITSSAWQYWQRAKNEDRATASIQYEQLLTHEASQHYSEVEFDVTSLLTNHPRTPYATLGAFMSAQNLINAGKMQAAIERFDWVLKNSKNKDFKQIASIRKARILLYLKQYDAALSLVTTVFSEAYRPLISEVKGDILAAKGDKQGAVAAYQVALQGLKQDEPNHSFLQMKYNQLSS